MFDDVGQFAREALAYAKIGDNDYLRPAALHAFKKGLHLEFDDHNPHLPPQVIVREGTGRWLALAIDENFDDQTLIDLIDNFDAEYAQIDLDPDGGYDYNEESLSARIVDVLLEAQPRLAA